MRQMQQIKRHASMSRGAQPGDGRARLRIRHKVGSFDVLVGDGAAWTQLWQQLAEFCGVRRHSHRRRRCLLPPAPGRRLTCNILPSLECGTVDEAALTRAVGVNIVLMTSRQERQSADQQAGAEQASAMHADRCLACDA